MIKTFKDAASFEAWLEKQHAKSDEIWIRYFKKATGKASVTYLEALHVALCFGWIDGAVRPYDEHSWIQRYTPRRKRSIWSKRNTGFAEDLIKSGKMRPAGLAQVTAAKEDGRWKAAYSSPKNAKPPADFMKRLSENKKALAFFKTLSKTNVFAIVYRLETAKKPETRERRMKLILEMLRAGKKFH